MEKDGIKWNRIGQIRLKWAVNDGTEENRMGWSSIGCNKSGRNRQNRILSKNLFSCMNLIQPIEFITLISRMDLLSSSKTCTMQITWHHIILCHVITFRRI